MATIPIYDGWNPQREDLNWFLHGKMMQAVCLIGGSKSLIYHSVLLIEIAQWL
ncbi:hypothetical protein [Sediminibacillus sp. JSM 1682029]|uniref:hypothetical protein n=1 Tax=Sediminibacillus sp. JSM 1682029 TaxID=3229857 RepID=UPI003525EFCC